MVLAKLRRKRAADETVFSVKLRLKKSEKKLLERAADAQRVETHDGKPPVASLVVTLVRRGLRCIRDHADIEEPEYSQDEALQAGLSLRGGK